MEALVHSIETFGTVDGPGIRFVLFLKGCPLRCMYCHNPDTWTNENAKVMTDQEILKEVLKYRSYYENGGVTISGGEPLVQLDFLISFCKLLKENNFHVAVDTSGCLFNINDKRYFELIKYVDLFLLDIKQVDPIKHYELTHYKNDNILAFAKFLSDQNKDVWIRHVLVPGYTLEEESLLKFKEFISTLKNIKKIELLKYHTMGKVKYDKLNLKYALEGVRAATKEDLLYAKKIIGIED